MGHQVIEQVVNAARRKLLVQDLIPLYYPNLYATFELSGKALETTKKYLEHLAVFEGFLAFSSIDLISRLEQRPKSNYLTDSEISRFVSDAGFHKETLAKKYAGMRLHPTAYKSVGKVHAKQRLEAVRDYLAFLYEKLGDDLTRYEAVDDVRKRFNRKIKAASPGWKKTRIGEVKGLTDGERDQLLEVMHPESPANPFANEAIKLRNFIILLLGLDMGLRRSEMLLIKTSDIHWHNRQLAVVNIEDESMDPRRVAPQFKTHERMLVMTDEVYDAIIEYESKYRRTKPRQGSSQARKHPFLLVSHRKNEGEAMSIKALDGVFARVGEVVPELAHIHPHILRHDSVYTMLESMREELETLTPEDRTTQVQKTLTWMFGWSPESHMPGLYGAKFWKEEADKAMKKRSGRLKAIRENVEDKVRKGATK
ncbi:MULTISPECIES: site-specific integrase [Marinobacter]|jgi:integrase|uniref:Site-specific integrase n=1 Tax=Marinobacter metalliresistant TaxID=2961995 RepID=A0ABZ2W063_9GAMM|nr:MULTISPECIES: site-specific integrase [unclassified Marinobacter]AKV97103.1 integrase [Marinobacter sp. CP1]MAC22668.1 site-specific integrase [Marinobacter sp.]PHS45238.1 MAG: integrase [Marinobacter sp.]PTB94728.1 site-specific integrase [Marinobacter sp. B9-2]|tara:strand:+ start:231 stop:1502 length:1272 start_codon:yes stop_codon:yes gene_type:complete